MQESMRSSAGDDLLLETELDKLFALQDKPLSKEKRAILVKELIGTGMPVRALLSALRSLMNEDLGAIKFGTICAEARKFIEPEERESCEECLSGYIVMKDEQGRSFSLACRCPEGMSKAAVQGLSRWGGENTQMSKGRLLVRA